MNVEEWREWERVRRGLLTEPDGYYSFPIFVGALFSPTGKLELIGYHPEAAAFTLITATSLPNDENPPPDDT